jgi:hypothetical protein
MKICRYRLSAGRLNSFCIRSILQERSKMKEMRIENKAKCVLVGVKYQQNIFLENKSKCHSGRNDYRVPKGMGISFSDHTKDPCFVAYNLWQCRADCFDTDTDPIFHFDTAPDLTA